MARRQPSRAVRAAAPAPRHAEQDPGPRPGLLLVGALLLVACAYLPALGGPLVWDDRLLLEQAERTRAFTSLSDYFDTSFWDDAPSLERTTSFFRPLVTMSFALEGSLHGLNPTALHATNLALHLGCLTLLFVLLARAVRPGVAALATLAWGLIPRLAECVAWVAGRTDVLAALLGLGAVLAFRRGPDAPRSTLRIGLAAAALFCALLAKEVAVAVLLGLALEAWVEGRRRGEGARRELLALGLALTAYLFLRARALGGLSGGFHFPETAGHQAQAVLEAVGRYAFMIVTPFLPDTQIGHRRFPDPRWAAAGLATLVGLGALGWRRGVAIARAPAQTLGAAATVAVSLGLVVHVLPLPLSVSAADRFLYLPLAFLTLLAAPWVDRLTRPAEAARRAVPLALIACLGLATLTWRRATTWTDEVELWATELRQGDHRDPIPFIRLGLLYAEAAMFEDALRAYGVHPTTQTGARNVAVLLRRVGRCQESTELWRAALDGPSARVADYPGAVRSWLCLGDAAGAALLAREAQARFPGPASDELAAEVTRLTTAEAPGPGGGAADHERRALYALERGRDREAVAAYADVAAAPDARPDQVARAALYLLRNGPLEAARAATERASAMSAEGAPGLEALWAERSAQTARLEAVRPLLP